VNVEVQETGAYVVSFAELPALREPAG
jgi:hypothetical protein